jgi:RNA polymerase sigma-70 factor (ECF subfamily)
MSISPADEFDLLMRGQVRALYRAAYRWTGDVDEAEDLVQETLTKLFSQIEQLRQIEQVRPWATRVMYRIFIDDLRRKRRSPVSFVGRSGTTGTPSEDDEEDTDAPDVTWDPQMLTEQALDRDRITATWLRLPEQHRVVLSLHEIEGYSLEEVAAMVEVPLGTVKSRLNRARQKLRELLTEGTNSTGETCNPSETVVSDKLG